MRLIQIWIASIALVLVATMGIGAMTRLTDSGLSIVEWKPVSGVFPPLSEEQWLREFKSYQQYPDFKARAGMQVEQFKKIFWWEFIHRLVARSILLVLLIPYVLLWVAGRLESRHHRKVLVLLLLGTVQGALGWYMVKSGLVHVPRVSHFRLTVHLLWACLIVAYLARWLKEERSKSALLPPAPLFIRILSWLCFLQLGLGALVAGSRAGYIYNTFPKFGETWWPSRFFIYADWVENLFYNQINLQLYHRVGGWLILLAAVYAFARRYYGISSLILLQFVLGVLTLVMRIPPVVATLHQLTGVLLFFVLRYLCSDSFEPRRFNE